MGDIRVISLMEASAVESQAIYHAVAEVFGSTTPDTILLVRPREPYLCLGYHQDPTRELDLAAVARRGLPLLRREVGGGAVYLDAGQVFLQWVMAPSHLPYALGERYRVFAEPIVATYRRFGIPAELRPVNDIHVRGRKIGGCGAARIGGAEVVVSSFIVRIDVSVLVETLRVDSAKMRDKVYQQMSEYVTSIEREAGDPPLLGELVGAYREEVQRVLGRRLVDGELTAEEHEALTRVSSRLADPAWVEGGGGRRVLGVKVHEGRAVQARSHKAAGGLVRWVVVVEDGRLVDATLEGDFTIEPASAAEALADAVVGKPIEDAPALVRALARELVAQAPGVEPEDLAAPLVGIAEVVAGARGE
jgi:lipoate-protein ligase A